MEKPIIAVSLSGVVVSNEPFKRIHEFGINELAKLSNMPELVKKIGEDDYFVHVKKALKNVYYDLSMEEAITKRRNLYCRRVVEMIYKNPNFIRRDVINFLRENKEKYNLVIVTNFLEKYVYEIFKIARVDGIFRYVSASKPKEEEDKEIVIGRLIGGFGHPEKLIGSVKSEKLCDKYGIELIEFDCDGDNIERLKERF